MLSKSLDTARMNADGLALLMAGAAQAPLSAPLPADSGTVVDITA